MGENFPAHENSTQADTNTAHVFRYYLARGFIEPGDVVNDVASGWGYGSNILSRSRAAQVKGFDYDQPAVEEAAIKYPHIEFSFTNLDTIPLVLPECDVSVSIETIEHLNDPVAFATALKVATRRIIILTTPIVPTTQAALGPEKGSPWHHHDFSVVSINNIFLTEGWRSVGDCIIGYTGFFVYGRS